MALATVVLALAALGGGSSPSQTVTLAYVRFKGVAGNYTYGNSYCSMRPIGDDTGMPPAPKGLIRPHFFQLEILDGSERRVQGLLGVLGRSSERARKIDRIWVDWNHDGKFGPEERADGSGSVFTPVKPPKAEQLGTAIRLRLGPDGVSVEPAGYRVGTATIAGHKVRVGAVDADLDGLFRPGRDRLLVDYSGHGDARLEDVSFGSRVLMPDRHFYWVRVTPTGNHMVLRRIDVPLASIKLQGARQASVTLVQAAGDVDTRAFGGACPALPGTYRGLSAKVVRNGWTYSVYGLGSQFVLQAGKALTLQAGIPTKVSLKVSRSQAAYSFSAELVAAKNTSFNGVYSPSGAQSPPPTLSIRDPHGRVVKGLNFEYG